MPSLASDIFPSKAGQVKTGPGADAQLSHSDNAAGKGSVQILTLGTREERAIPSGELSRPKAGF